MKQYNWLLVAVKNRPQQKCYNFVRVVISKMGSTKLCAKYWKLHISMVVSGSIFLFDVGFPWCLFLSFPTVIALICFICISLSCVFKPCSFFSSLPDCVCVQGLPCSLFASLLYLTGLYLFGPWILPVPSLPESANRFCFFYHCCFVDFVILPTSSNCTWNLSISLYRWTFYRDELRRSVLLTAGENMEVA